MARPLRKQPSWPIEATLPASPSLTETGNKAYHGYPRIDDVDDGHDEYGADDDRDIRGLAEAFPSLQVRPCAPQTPHWADVQAGTAQRADWPRREAPTKGCWGDSARLSTVKQFGQRRSGQ